MQLKRVPVIAGQLDRRDRTLRNASLMNASYITASFQRRARHARTRINLHAFGNV